MINLQQTLVELTELPVADRLTLIASLWDSIPENTAVEITPDQREELRRRMLAHEQNPNDLLTWEQVLDIAREST